MFSLLVAKIVTTPHVVTARVAIFDFATTVDILHDEAMFVHMYYP